jgi:hypothetical protein
LLVIVAGAIGILVGSQWDLFAAKDYEECALRAAKNARSNDALAELFSLCGNEFAGRRKAGGGYSYYDACQNRSFAIKGPNPTADERRDIDKAQQDTARQLQAAARAGLSHRLRTHWTQGPALTPVTVFLLFAVAVK